jgi:hypothetical protein
MVYSAGLGLAGVNSFPNNTYPSKLRIKPFQVPIRCYSITKEKQGRPAMEEEQMQESNLNQLS